MRQGVCLGQGGSHRGTTGAKLSGLRAERVEWWAWKYMSGPCTSWSFPSTGQVDFRWQKYTIVENQTVIEDKWEEGLGSDSFVNQLMERPQ